MVAGLPGFGLSGVFFLISALLMVPIEAVATLRGRSSLARWGVVLRSAGIALAIVAGLELTYAALHLAVTQLFGSVTTAAQAPVAAGHGSVAGAHGGVVQAGAPPSEVVHAMPVAPILGTIGLVAIVIVAGKAAEIVSDVRGRRRMRSRARSATALAELRSLEERRRAHVVEDDRFADELERPLRVASGRSR